MNAISESRLQLVCPKLADLVHRMASLLGEPLVVEQGLRAWSDQAKLYAQGRTAPGPIVTHAQPGYSWHNFGLAVDVCPERLLTVPNWGPGDPVWIKLRGLGFALGMYPGADFSHPDQPHFQLTGRFPVSPDDEVRQVFKDGGMSAVWDEAFNSQSS